MANKLADRGQRPHRAPHNKFSQGNFSKAISDRSGLEFPYNEMMFEWNGSFVHFSEFEQKHPQLSLMYFTDSETLENARPQANLSATGGVPNQIDLIFPSTSGSVSNNGISQASTNLLSTALGSVTIVIS
jgi:hypothetical protein|tara:strand:+ start:2615 stop:3004 length:390 start_codon:yes stop_codon:yes gene_type:complete